MIWLNLPVDNYANQIDFKTHWLFGNCSIDSEEESLINEIVSFKFKDEYVVNSWWQRQGVKFIMAKLLPLRVNFYLEPVNNGEDFSYAVTIQSSKIQRLYQVYVFLIQRTPGFKKDYKVKYREDWQLIEPANASKEQYSASFKDLLVFSNDAKGFDALIDELSLENQKDNLKPDYYIYTQVSDDVGLMDYYVEKVKNEASYDLFPTISNIAQITLSLSYSNKDMEHAGCISFKALDTCDMKKIKSDVRFFMQFFKRVVDANGYKMLDKIEIDKNVVSVKFNITKN